MAHKAAKEARKSNHIDLAESLSKTEIKKHHQGAGKVAKAMGWGIEE